MGDNNININNLQYIQDVPKEDIIKISQRIVDLGHMTADEKRIILSFYSYIVNGRVVKFPHPDRPKLTARLTAISTQMTSEKRTLDNCYPGLRRGTRQNIYVIEDYERFGDDIINQYIADHPINTWGFDWHWGDSLERASTDGEDTD